MKNYVTLGEVCSKGSSNIAQKDIEYNNGEYAIYGASGYIKNVDFYHQDNSYVAVVKDGAGIGRTMLLPAKTSVIGTMQYLIPNELVDVKYLYYAVTFMNLSKYYSGAAIPHIYFKDYRKEKLPLPTYEEQQEIISILNRIDNLINICITLCNRFDLLVKSRFMEMFGDPVSNPLNWDTKPLLSLGNCKNGMNFHYDENGVEINCLGVGDFKDLSIIANTTILPTIILNEMPSKEYLLQNDDIVFVRSNGNKALVGRSVAVYPNKVPTTFSGFCIRFRKHDDTVIVPYLLRVLKTDSIRNKMKGRGANIQNLNQQILSTLEIPIPPLELQCQFADFVAQTDKSKLAVKQILEKAETLKKSLMQEYFG